VKAFAYERAESPEAVVAAARAGARILSGGTDLIPLMQEHLVEPDRVVDATRIGAKWRQIEETAEGGLWIGGLATLSQLAVHPVVRGRYQALAEAAASAATPQIRNLATVGGNLCQWSRCWYFRSGVRCFLAGGDGCPAVAGDHRFHAIFRSGPCISVHPSDPAVALLAFSARVIVQGPGGRREVPLGSFIRQPGGGPQQVDLSAGEFVVALSLPPFRGRSVYRKAMARQVWSFALASVAVAVESDGGRIHRAAVALGGVAGVPWSAERAAAVLQGGRLDDETAARAAEAAVEGADPLPGNAYKVELVKGLVRSALADLQG
jgi:xanthine dehydrogenase YagS FAD-binding subunit